ncbi:MAG: NAD(P)/FAD-dependent oxidoreductase [Chlamydiales bacterium]
MGKKRVVIVGGGFGGLNAAKSLNKTELDILLIDKTNHHLFQPLLYQVATAVLSPGDIATPIREVLKHQKNTHITMGNVISVDKQRKQIVLDNGEKVSYDYLILAPGARHSYFGHDQWESFAPGLKSLNDAIDIRENVLLAFEKAERCEHPSDAEKYLRFVVIGGGPTGVELASTLAEIAKKSLFRNFRKIKPENSEIFLIEGAERLLQSFPKNLSIKAEQYLKKIGIKVLTDTLVTNIESERVYIGDRVIEANNVIWAAGNQASSLLKTLETPLDNAGRMIVNSDLTIPGHPEIFVIGDASHALDEKKELLPGIAPVAIQQGRYVAKIIKKNLLSTQRLPFRYFDKGNLAIIGKAKAVGMVGKVKFSGLSAWLVWSLIHIFYLINFANRLFVLSRWMFWYFTARLRVGIIKKPIFEEHPPVS